MRILVGSIVSLLVLAASAAMAQPNLGPTCHVTITPPTKDIAGNPLTGVVLTWSVYDKATAPVVGTDAPLAKGLTGTSWTCPPLLAGTHTFWATYSSVAGEGPALEASPAGGTGPGPFVFVLAVPASAGAVVVSSP